MPTTQRSRLLFRGAMLGLVLLVAGAVSGATPEQRCTAAKVKAFGATVAAQARCQASRRSGPVHARSTRRRNERRPTVWRRSSNANRVRAVRGTP